MRCPPIVVVGLLVPLLALATAHGQEAPPPAKSPDLEVRGMTISCQTWGWEWGSADMHASLKQLKAQGCNWITIHPYAGIRHNGQVRSYRMGDQAPEWLTKPIAWAHELGLKIMIKPHLAYWGTKWSWRGEIEFQTEEEWTRFFDSYEAWLLQVVEHCQQADAFAVGTELDRMTGKAHEGRWRQIVKKVRAKTKAPLTYAANWDAYRRCSFWDALDVVGIQSYFPLVNHQRQPTAQELAAGWKRVLGRLGEFSQETGKKIVLTELGYDCAPYAARTPWKENRGPRDVETQKRCMEAALAALDGQQVVVGAFLWKWFAGRTRGENFLMNAEAMRDVIKGAWAP